MADATETYDLALLAASRAKWDASPGLREAYGDIARRLKAASVRGDTVEVGSGIGWLRDFWPGIVTTDLERTPWADHAASAYDLAALGRTWGNVVAVDVLHHLVEPRRFLASAASVLRPGGRLLLCEPAATPWGRLFYGLCHHEPMVPSRLGEPWVFPPDDAEGRFANMAMATALFGRSGPSRAREAELGLRLAARRHFGLVAYPLTGGFSRPQLAGTRLLRRLLDAEASVPEPLARLTGLRVLVTLERLAT